MRARLDAAAGVAPECSAAAVFDLHAELVLGTSLEAGLPQERLDTLCRLATDLLQRENAEEALIAGRLDLAALCRLGNDRTALCLVLDRQTPPGVARTVLHRAAALMMDREGN